MSDRALRVAVAGCGLIGNKRAEALGKDELIGCFDIDSTRAGALASSTGARACTSFDELLELRPDVVVVATFHNELASLSEQAVDSGAHVLVEKPGGIGSEQLDRLGKAADRANRLVKVGFNHRFHPGIARAITEARSGIHGEILFARARYGHGGRQGYETEWRLDPAISGGGELVDQGMHLLDLSFWLMGELPLHSALLRTHYWDAPVEDNAALILGEGRNGSSPWAMLHASWTEWKNLFSFEVFGRTGKLQIDGLGGSYGPERLTYFRMLPQMGPPEITVYDYPAEDTSWETELAAFTEAIGDDPAAATNLEDAAAVFAVADQLYGRRA